MRYGYPYINLFFTLIFVFFLNEINAQNTGGRAVFNFIKLSNTPQLTALGGINISSLQQDVGLSFHNPALLDQDLHTATNLVFNSMPAGIKNVHLSGAWHHEGLGTTFGIGINYFGYGNMPQTDASGNDLGSFNPRDVVVQFMAARKYLNFWHYGLSLKIIGSDYGLYKSSGLAMDVGIRYYDSSSKFQASLVLKNMGIQLRAYDGGTTGNLPFDIQLGFSKKLNKAPVTFSVTTHHLHHFDLLYNDTAFNQENGFGLTHNGKGFTVDKLFRHFVLGTQIMLEKRVEISLGYNHLRRAELNIGNGGNGLNGFSMGLGIHFRKIQLRYARTYYQRTAALNQFGLNIALKDYLN